MTAADKYFLKAKDNYPYYLDDAIEALEYGLACDNEHAGLLTLQGIIYFKDLKQFEAAKECFELALFYDSGYTVAWYAYIAFSIEMNDYSKADKLVESALKVKGIELARVLYLSARSAEVQGKHTIAIDMMKKARVHCICKDCYKFYEEEIERVSNKVNNAKEQKLSVPAFDYCIASTLSLTVGT